LYMTGEDSEPPDGRQKNSNLVEIIKNEESVFLSPGPSELAVLNPAFLNGHLLYRVRKRHNNRYGEISYICYRKLVPPFQLNGEPRTILFPEHDYEKDGIEDPRVSYKDGLYYITYVAYNEDEGARIALATTEDFRKIYKKGLIGPNIKLSEGIELSRRLNSRYGLIFENELKEKRKKNPNSDPIIMDKDATIVYSSKWRPILLHRIGNHMQATPFSSIEELQHPEFWRDKLGKLEKDTILCPGEGWASEKVGLGGTPIDIDGKILGHIHGVEKKRGDKMGDKMEEYIYKTTFAEFDPRTYEILAILRDPPLVPDNECVFIGKSGEIIIIKHVIFGTAMARVGGEIISLFGKGDLRIDKDTCDKNWLLGELSHPHNQLKNWQFSSN